MFFGAQISLVCDANKLIYIKTKLIYVSNKKITNARRVAKCLRGFTMIKYFYFRRINNKTLEKF
jgi:hypothetical protein